MLGQNRSIQDFQLKFPLFFYFICLLFFLLGIRLTYLQIIKGELYRAFSENNSLRQEKIPAPRGQILDRERKILVDNRLQLDVVITPQFAVNRDQSLARIAKFMGEPVKMLKSTYDEGAKKNPRFMPITLVENAPWPLVVQIEGIKAELPGVSIAERIRRTYVQKNVGAQLFGYLSEVSKKDIEGKALKDQTYNLGDMIGRSGLESYYEKTLRGQDGAKFVVVNAHGQSIGQNEGEKKLPLAFLQQSLEPKPGKRLILTIDADLQEAAAKSMEGKMGGVVALDPRTGEVLTMISMPAYDPTEMNSSKGPDLWRSMRNNPYGLLRNKNIHDHFSPGSTFKIVTALSGLENGFIKPETILNCPPTLRLGNRIFHEHNKEGYGRISVHDAIKKSSDVFFYQVGLGLGVDKIAEVAHDLGLGERSGIDLGAEIPGHVPSEKWAREDRKAPWQAGETPSLAIGQGPLDVTPLQMAIAFATVANGGNLYKPYVVSQIESPEGNLLESFTPQLRKKRPIPPDIREVLMQAMYDVVNSPGGTASITAATKDKLISGKTGTVQVKSMTKEQLFSNCLSMPYADRHHGWFVGYAPKENPEIAIAAFVQHGCSGSREAAPVVKAIVEKWWQKKMDAQKALGPQPASQPASGN